jgi:hypothetical protein
MLGNAVYLHVLYYGMGNYCCIGPTLLVAAVVISSMRRWLSISDRCVCRFTERNLMLLMVSRDAAECGVRTTVQVCGSE